MTRVDALLAEQPVPIPTLTTTGWPTLDRITGGFPEAGVWIVTGGPRKGASTFLREWAGRLALAEVQTLLTGPEPDPVETAHYLAGAYRHRTDWSDVALYIARSSSLPRNVGTLGAVILDRADLMSGATPDAIRAMADDGCCVIANLPRRKVVHGEGAAAELDHEWAEVADLIVEVELHRGLGKEMEDHEVTLWALLNRHGPMALAVGTGLRGYVPILEYDF